MSDNESSVSTPSSQIVKRTKPRPTKRDRQRNGDGAEAATSNAAVKAKMETARKKIGFAQMPPQLKKLRACMICSLVKAEADFDDKGCDNCDRFLQVAGNRGSVYGYTSGNYEGLIGLMEPEESWVAKWQRIVHKKPGLYAVNVFGEVERWVKREMEDAGISYVSRDKSKRVQKETEIEEVEWSRSNRSRDVSKRQPRGSRTRFGANDESDESAGESDEADGHGNFQESRDDASEIGSTAPVNEHVVGGSRNEPEQQLTPDSEGAGITIKTEPMDRDNEQNDTATLVRHPITAVESLVTHHQPSSPVKVKMSRKEKLNAYRSDKRFDSGESDDSTSSENMSSCNDSD